MIIKIAWQSLLNRKTSVLLTILSITISVALLVSVGHIRKQAKESFNRTVSGVDLIVGARTGQLNLLLYSIFRVGHATNNIDWKHYQDIANSKNVAWSIPISLGDSHKGFRVMGTSRDYFTHYKFGNKQELTFKQGRAFNGMFEAVIGADLANKLAYKIGQKIVLSHGVGNVSFTKHDHFPFTIVGILAPTGTPVDKTVHVSLSGIEAVHMSPRQLASLKSNKNPDIEPQTITAFMLGLTSKIAIFKVQKQINEYTAEPLLAIMPGVALAELWQMLGTVENIFIVISALILVSALLGLSTMLLASMRERQRELAVLRAIGAGPFVIFMLIQTEAILLSLIAIVTAIALVWLGLVASEAWLSAHYGLFIDSNIFNQDTLINSVIVLISTILIAMIPAISAYRTALHSGLSSGG